MAGGSKGAKGGRCPRPPGAGLKGGLGCERDFPRLSPVAPLLSSSGAPLPRGPRPGGGCRCAGMRPDEPRCRRGPGPLGGRVTEEAKPRAGSSLPPTPGVSAPSPQPRPPRSARGPPQEPGVRSLRTPHSHLLCSALPPSQARASALPPPGLPPGWEGAAVPPPRPFPPGPAAAARPDAGLAARGQAAPPTDGCVSRLLGAGIPRVGGGRRRARGREGGGGGGGGRGGDRSRP